MKTTLTVLLLTGISSLCACEKTPAGSPSAAPTEAQAPAEAAKPAAEAANPHAAAAPAAAPGMISGAVKETMNSGGYTYVQVDTADGPVWAAGPEIEVTVGDLVSFAAGTPMKGYHSKTLDRTFEVVLFVPAITKGAAAPAVDSATPHPPAQKSAEVDLTGIEKAPGGKTIAEIFAGKDASAGQEVSVRGKVVKFNAEIMGRNWFHLKDGTGESGSDDLTITAATDVKAAVGDTVLVVGKVGVNKDFGAGYKYSVLIEDAKITVE